jgi:hypothetical protein
METPEWIPADLPCSYQRFSLVSSIFSLLCTCSRVLQQRSVQIITVIICFDKLASSCATSLLELCYPGVPDLSFERNLLDSKHFPAPNGGNGHIPAVTEAVAVIIIFKNRSTLLRLPSCYRFPDRDTYSLILHCLPVSDDRLSSSSNRSI